MNLQLLCLFISSTTSETIINQSSDKDITNEIGIGGILATIIVGIVTCIVTWKLTMRSIKQQRLSYKYKKYSIISSSIQEQQKAFKDLVITYENKKLKNPCLLLLEIENTGNEAIVDPPICVRVDANTEIIPGYFQDVPVGYEDKWKINPKSKQSCNIILEHINPKQIVKVCFFLDNSPEKIEFECPMPNIDVQERSDNTSQMSMNTKRHFRRLEVVTFTLLFFTVMLFVSFDPLICILYDLNWHYAIPAPTSYIFLFVASILVMSILLNIFGIKQFDNYITLNKNKARLIKCTLLVISSILTYFILHNILFVNIHIQILVAIIIIIMLSILIHIISIE